MDTAKQLESVGLETVGRFAPLMASLATVALELDADGVILSAQGAVPRFFGSAGDKIEGLKFADSIRSEDRSLWELISHRIRFGKKVGPVPVRLEHERGAETPVELVAVPIDNGHTQVALNPLSYTNATPRPDAAASRMIDANETHFLILAKRLIDYGKTVGSTPGEALVTLAGLASAEDVNERRAAKQLCALHRLLVDTVKDVDALMPEAEAMPEGQTAILETSVPKEPPAEEGGDTPEAAPELTLQNVTDVIRSKRGSGLGTAGCLTVAGWDGLSESDIVRAAGYAVRKTTATHRHHSLDKLAGTVEARVEEAKEQLKRFRQMVVQERFDVALQPIIDLQTGVAHHYEALVRFDPRFFEGSPFEMIRFAEEIGMIQDFDSAMTMKVISLIRRLRRIGYDVKMAVNLSGRSLQSPAFLRNLFRILDDASDVRSKLSFELTESSRIANLTGVNKSLQRIRRLGFKVALDDFGAGSAGLQYLQAFDVDVVKIDRQYVVRAVENLDDRAFFESLLDLTATRGIETVGEGVDSELSDRMLKDLGVTYGQGYLYGRPAPIDQVFGRTVD